MQRGIKSRHSTRLKNYDYSKAGIYFVTICVKDRKNLFGKIKGEEMILNDLGKIIEAEWLNIPGNYLNIELDEFIIMPNHLHGIVIINDVINIIGAIHGDDSRFVGAIHELPLQSGLARRKMLIPKIIGFFKMNSAKQINHNLNRTGTSVWQRNYYDHIIRNE